MLHRNRLHHIPHVTWDGTQSLPVGRALSPFAPKQLTDQVRFNPATVNNADRKAYTPIGLKVLIATNPTLLSKKELEGSQVVDIPQKCQQ